MSIEYDNYLAVHKQNVAKGWYWIKDHILDNLSDYLAKHYGNDWSAFDEDDILCNHDYSKTYADEYYAYDKYFYGGNKSYQVVKDFKEAFLTHIHRNPHHWQYWVLIHDDPNEKQEAIEMPIDYIFEMICDWWSFSWKKDNLTEIFDWWGKHKDYILLGKETRKTVEKILEEIKKVLDEEKSNDKSKEEFAKNTV